MSKRPATGCRILRHKTIKDDAIEKLRTKHNAIESERNWKIQDLISRYALSIQIEPVSAIRIETDVGLFEVYDGSS